MFYSPHNFISDHIFIYNCYFLLPLHIRFNKIDRFITVYDGARYLYCLVLKKRMPFPIALDMLKVKKLVLHMFFSNNYAKIKIDSYDSLLLKSTLTL